MEIFKSNKYIKDYLKHFSYDKHQKLIESILVIGIDFIKRIYEQPEILKKVKKIAQNIINTEYSNNYLQDSSLKGDIIKIQEEIYKLNDKFEAEMKNCACSKSAREMKETEKKLKYFKEFDNYEKYAKKPFKNGFLVKSDSLKKFSHNSITPKVTEIKHAFVKKSRPLHTKHHLDDTEMQNIFRPHNFFEDNSSKEKRSRKKKSEEIRSFLERKQKRSYSPPQKLTSPDSQKDNNFQVKPKIPPYLKKVNSKIKDVVDRHKRMNNLYKKLDQTKREEKKFIEEFGSYHNNNSEEENHKYADYLSNNKNSRNYMSSEKFQGKYATDHWKDDNIYENEYQSKAYHSSSGENMNIRLKEKKHDENLTEHVKSPTFLNVESQYLENGNNNENSQFKPKTLEFEKISNYSSNFNTRYNSNLLNNNHNILANNNNAIENSDMKKKTDTFNDVGGIKKEQSKSINENKDFDINKEFQYTANNFNEKESSISSNFSMFQPNEELKSFYQKELWNNNSFQKGPHNGKINIYDKDDSDDEGDFAE